MAQNHIFHGFVTALFMFAIAGTLLAFSTDLKANADCDTTCDSMVDLSVLFFFLGGAYGIGVGMGLLPPIAALTGSSKSR